MAEALQYPESISVEDYLSGERVAQVRHEYVDGRVFAMAGASARHGLVSGNLFAALHGHLRGNPCQIFASDMKVHLKNDLSERFYYPDLLVSCQQDEPDDYYRDHPQVIVEVLSDSTWRYDFNEKLPAYQEFESIKEIVFISAKSAQVYLFQRENDWRCESFALFEEILSIPSLDFEIDLHQIYEGVEFDTSPAPWQQDTPQ